MRSTLRIAALGALAGSAVAEDVLYSKRFVKRDDDGGSGGSWNMSFFHVNDVHAHLDEFAASGTDCVDPSKGCYGGYARIKTVADELREAHPDSLWLNAGDEFQGTLFYSFYGPEKIAETMNIMEFDAMTLGNHEWDGGDEQLGEYLANVTAPFTSCNVKSEYKPLRDKIKNYILFEDKGIAVIGATTQETPSISDVGNQTKFLDPIPEIQKAVYEIRNETTDIQYIVCLSHLGYDVDKELAEKTEGLSLIIGGHSHTLLGDMDGAAGKYPTLAENLNGDEVYIVTSYRWGEYLGSIELMFDAEGGGILGYRGAPIHLTNTTEQDKGLQAKVDDWRGPFEEFAAEVLGVTENELGQETCQGEDCLLGQVMADAMYEYRVNQTSSSTASNSSDTKGPDFAIINAGGVRATIDEGNITRGEVLTSFPFGNSLVEITLSGKEVLSVLEGAVSLVNQANGKEIGSWFQISESLRVEYNPDNKPGNRLVNATIDGKPIDDGADYNIVTLDFMAGGGDNILEETSDFTTLDLQDEVLVQYIQAHTPLKNTLQERVVKVDAQPSSDGGNDDESNSGDNGGSDDSAAGVLAAPIWTAMLGAAGVAVAAL